MGAVLPFLAVLTSVRRRSELDFALTAVIRGGYLAAVFGLYQLAAFYTGAPQVVEYTALGGDLGRISSFSHEAGYFGSYMVLVLAALFARAALRNQNVSWVVVALLVVVLLLANTRAVFLTVPLFAILMVLRRPRRRSEGRFVVGATALTLVGAGVWISAPGAVHRLTERASTIFDSAEATSNAPRLELLEAIRPIIEQNLIAGIGPGQLYFDGPTFGLVREAGATPNSVIADNIYYQALLDGGIVLLVAQLLFVIACIRIALANRDQVARALLAGYLAVVIPASLITSYFWDAKLWTVLATAVAASVIQSGVADDE